MAVFPGVADHWHVTTTRVGRWEFFRERLDRETALTVVRDMLLADWRTTGDPKYAAAVHALKQGYTSYQMGPTLYCAFACACPP